MNFSVFTPARRAQRFAVALLLVGMSSLTAHRPAAARPDSADARAAVPPLEHHSAFARAPAGTASAPIGWREANDRVGRIGGWRTYAREAQAPAATASAPAHRH
jgi:hypothetical protein